MTSKMVGGDPERPDRERGEAVHFIRLRKERAGRMEERRCFGSGTALISPSQAPPSPSAHPCHMRFFTGNQKNKRKKRKNQARKERSETTEAAKTEHKIQHSQEKKSQKNQETQLQDSSTTTPSLHPAFAVRNNQERRVRKTTENGPNPLPSPPLLFTPHSIAHLGWAGAAVSSIPCRPGDEKDAG